MNLKQLHYFCEVVDAGSAALAAARVHVAPTAISMQLSQLESELGGELFDRSRRPMELNALGRYFHPRARQLLAEAKRLHEETRSVAQGQSGALAIGYTRSTIFSILPRAIRTYRAKHPQVRIELLALLSEHQHLQLQNGRIQIGLSRYLGPVEPAEGLVTTPLLEDPFVAALPAGHALARRKALKVRELEPTSLITYPKDPQSRFAEYTVSMLKAAGVQPVVADEATDIHTALAMVSSGLGYSLVGRSVSRVNRDDVVFVPLADLADTASVVVVTKAGETGKVVADFVATLRSTTSSG